MAPILPRLPQPALPTRCPSPLLLPPAKVHCSQESEREGTSKSNNLKHFTCSLLYVILLILRASACETDPWDYHIEGKYLRYVMSTPPISLHMHRAHPNAMVSKANIVNSIATSPAEDLHRMTD